MPALLVGAAAAIALVAVPASGAEQEAKRVEKWHEMQARLAAEAKADYEASPFSAASRDYFLRFVRDEEARPRSEETVLDSGWRILVAKRAAPSTSLMASELADFLHRRMQVTLPVERVAASALARPGRRTLALVEKGGGDPEVPESFTLAVTADRVAVRGRDAAGLRDGVVRLVDRIGLRRAPFLSIGEQGYRPRLRTRAGGPYFGGSLRDIVFLGYNAAYVGGGLLQLSRSDAIPELARFRVPDAAKSLRKQAEEARRWGLRTYMSTGLRHFPKNDPVFLKHPEMRGALTWQADGEYVLCTEHPVVQRFLAESTGDVFRAAPELSGVWVIIGGESFYHCFMRAYGVAKGHTSCPRCEALGAERVVANLLNLLGQAARRVNPNAEILAWPYSAEHVWAADEAQAGLIRLLKPGTGILTEMEKDEVIGKPEGFSKHLWDYSIDLIGPGERAKTQIEECRAAGIPIFMKHEPGMAFEIAGVSHVPCLDRWLDRAEAMASCGAAGVMVASGVGPLRDNSAMEADRFAWWTPTPPKDEILQALAARIAGERAGPHLRKAWALVSAAIEFSPVIPGYYTGPRYLGPGHPMCADPEAKLPEVFHAKMTFMSEVNEAEGMALRPAFVTGTQGEHAAFLGCYRRMEALLRQAVAEVDAAEPLVPEQHRVLFQREVSDIRWYWHVTRAEANFTESCRLRDRLLALAKQASRTPEETAEAAGLYHRWREVLLDEKANAVTGLPVMEGDMRLDMYYSAFSHGGDMIRAKLQILDQELDEFLPSVARKLSIAAAPVQ